MAVGRYHILGNAKVTTITGGTLGPTGLSLTIADPTGWPSGGANGKFPIVINRGMSNEEHLIGQSRTGNTITIAALGDRGLDGTAAGTHDVDSVVYHGYLGTMADEANQHVNDPTQDHHTQYMMASGTRHDLTARHSVGTVVPVGNPGAFAIADTMSQGVATTAARSDHRHAGPGFGTPVAVGTANATGAAATVARSDHVHDLGNGSIDAAALFANGAISDAAKFSAALQPWLTQNTDPGAVGANRLWFDSSAARQARVRNAGNSGWEQIGSAAPWTVYTISITGFNIGAGVSYGRWKRIDATSVIVEFGFSIGAGASSTGAVLGISLPVAALDPGLGTVFNWIGAGRAFSPTAGRFASVGIINPATDPNNISSFATAGLSPWDNNSPFAPWTSGSIFNGFAAYETAPA